MAATTLGMFAGLLGAGLAGGCSSSRPSVSGFGIGTTTFVSVGETLTLRLPVDDDGAMWRVSSFDSLFVELVDPPRLMTEPGKDPYRRVVIRATNPGETEIELSKPDTKTGRVHTETRKISIFK
jgi:hypothetical protein